LIHAWICSKNYKYCHSIPIYLYSASFHCQEQKLLTSNTEIHDIYTHNNYNLHLTSTNLSVAQKDVLFSGSKICNNLPTHIKLSGDVKHFKSLLRSYINI
jgi:hypothetical protein